MAKYTTAALASLTSGVLMCNFSLVRELMEDNGATPYDGSHVKLKEKILQQFPLLPERGVNRENFKAKLAEAEATYGETVTLRK